MKSIAKKIVIFGGGLILLSGLLLCYAEPALTTPQYGGVLKIIHQQTMNTAYGWAPTSRGPALYQALPAVETLLHTDENGIPSPWLIESWEISPVSITFDLKKGVKFHDGTDFNADAVKYALDTYRDAGMAQFKLVTSIDVLDDYTVRLNLSQFDNGILYALCVNAGMMVAPTTLAKGQDWATNNLVGTGPFKQVDFKRQQYLKFERFDDYWQEGKPYLDGIEYISITDTTVAAAAFQAGEGHALVFTSAGKEMADLQKLGKYNLTMAPKDYTELAADWADPDSPFADIKVRQAVAYAIDNAALAKNIGYGFYKPVNQMAEEGSWAYNPDVVGYPYDPQKARSLLKEAGYPDGFTCKLNANSTPPELMNMWTAVQGYLTEVGINGEIEPIIPTTWFGLMVEGWKGLCLYSIGGSADDYFLKYVQDNMSIYPSVPRPAPILEKVNKGLEATDYTNAQVLAKEVQKMIIDEYCLVWPLYRTFGICAQYPQVHDTGIFEDDHIKTWKPEDAWLSK